MSNSRIKISELPYIDGLSASPLDVLHIIKYPEKQGRKISLSDLGAYFSTSSLTSSYSVSSSNALTASYVDWNNVANIPSNIKSWTFPFPSSSSSTGSEGMESYNEKFYALYTSGSWRRDSICLF